MTVSTIADHSTMSFTVPRESDFFSEAELTKEMGISRRGWGLAIIKELFDNSLDACESAGIRPELRATMSNGRLLVTDNGPGLPPGTIEKSLNYNIRVSTKVYRILPSRGRQGHGLKCVFAVPYVTTNQSVPLAIVIETQEREHTISIAKALLADMPILTHRTEQLDKIGKNGTSIDFEWPDVASYLYEAEGLNFSSLDDLACAYAVFNPHADIRVFDEMENFELLLPSSGKAESPPWDNSKGSSVLWYSEEEFRRLFLSAINADDPDTPRTTLQLVQTFHGFTGRKKSQQTIAKAFLAKQSARKYLKNFVLTDGDTPAVDEEGIRSLFEAMRSATKPVKPRALGVLGRDRFLAALHEHFNATLSAEEEGPTSEYRMKPGTTTNGVPFVVEVAFSPQDSSSDDEKAESSCRRLVVGLNWSPCLEQFPFTNLWSILYDNCIEEEDPVVLGIHIATPSPGQFHNRGKGSIDLDPNLAACLEKLVAQVAVVWRKHKEKMQRNQKVQSRAEAKSVCTKKNDKAKLKQAAFDVMVASYQKAAGVDPVKRPKGYPANARQIMYVARPWILEALGWIWKKDSYFTQILLPDFIQEFPELTADWDVVYDDRGHFYEPFTGRNFGLGTLAVRDYIAGTSREFQSGPGEIRIPIECETNGPEFRYKTALFIEKEGFFPLIERAGIAEEFDLALMSSKGMSTTAARQLVQWLSNQGVRILTLHDFDKAGFSIAYTLRTNSRRHKYADESSLNVEDLGLRLDDVNACRLASEPVEYQCEVDPRLNIRRSGGTDAEAEFLVRERANKKLWRGERVELNALTSDQFVDFLRAKLTAANVTKVVPEESVLQSAFCKALIFRDIQRAVDEVLMKMRHNPAIRPPHDLRPMVLESIQGTNKPWEKVLQEIALKGNS